MKEAVWARADLGLVTPMRQQNSRAQPGVSQTAPVHEVTVRTGSGGEHDSHHHKHNTALPGEQIQSVKRKRT